MYSWVSFLFFSQAFFITFNTKKKKKKKKKKKNSAIASVSIDPGIEGVGIGWMFTIVGLLVTISNIAVPVLIKFGPKWRARRAERYKESNGNLTFTFFKPKK
jgi:uncharacterized membrane protein